MSIPNLRLFKRRVWLAMPLTLTARAAALIVANRWPAKPLVIMMFFSLLEPSAPMAHARAEQQ